MDLSNLCIAPPARLNYRKSIYGQRVAFHFFLLSDYQTLSQWHVSHRQMIMVFLISLIFRASLQSGHVSFMALPPKNPNHKNYHPASVIA